MISVIALGDLSASLIGWRHYSPESRGHIDISRVRLALHEACRHSSPSSAPAASGSGSAGTSTSAFDSSSSRAIAPEPRPLFSIPWSGPALRDYFDRPPTDRPKRPETQFVSLRSGDVVLVAGVAPGCPDVDVALLLETLTQTALALGAALRLKDPVRGLNAAALRNDLADVFIVLDQACQFGIPCGALQGTGGAELAFDGQTPTAAHALAPALAPSFGPKSPAAGAGPAPKSRDSKVKYRNNEVWLDLIEGISATLGAGGRGEPLSVSIEGVLTMRSRLSGMVEARLGFNEELVRAVGSAMRAHPCVNLGDLSRSGALHFIPPDGEAALLNYRLPASPAAAPFALTCTVSSETRNRLDLEMRLTQRLPPNTAAEHVKILVTLPPNATRVLGFDASKGTYKVNWPTHEFKWKLKGVSAAGDNKAEYVARVSIELISTLKEPRPWTRPPAALRFEVPGYAASGGRVQYCRIVSSSYADTDVSKWIRMKSTAGSYLAPWSDS